MSTVLEPFRRVSLTLRMVVLTALVGYVVWAVLDYIQTRALVRIFQTQLTVRLSQEALEDRLNFDRYITAHHQLVRILAGQAQLNEYIAGQNWSPGDTVHIKYWRKQAPWLPRLSTLRTFTRPRHALLLDAQGRAREIFWSSKEKLPGSLLTPDTYLLAQSHDQSFITAFDGNPYLVTAESVTNAEGAVLATLMLASPIDDEFLVDSQGIYRGRLIALVMGERSKIVTSSDLDLLPAESFLDGLKDRYIVTGQEYYEFGESELAFKVASFVARDEIDSMTDEVVTEERRQRAIMAFALILSFAGVMTWITRRIEKLTHRIIDFSEEVSYDPMEAVQGKDKLAILENRFQCLMKGVTHSQAIIRSMFSSYVSPKVVEELLANPEKAKLGAQRKNVTILFADLVGFTGLAEKLDPEEVVALLNDFFNAMTDIIIKWDGTIDKIVGDEIMAFWGAPVETPNHAELAVRCALHMTKAMQELVKKWEDAGRTTLDCGIGLHTGEVLVGNIGAEGRILDYTIIGDPVNIAARVESLTRQYQANILVTESTFKHIQPLVESGDIRRVQLIERGFVKVKGRDKDVHIYELREK